MRGEYLEEVVPYDGQCWNRIEWYVAILTDTTKNISGLCLVHSGNVNHSSGRLTITKGGDSSRVSSSASHKVTHTCPQSLVAS